MDHLVAAAIAEQLRDLAALVAHDAGACRRPNRPTVRARPRGRRRRARRRGRRAGSRLRPRARRPAAGSCPRRSAASGAVVDDQRAARRAGCPRSSACARSSGWRGGMNQVHGAPVGQRRQRVGDGAARDRHAAAGGERDLGGGELGHHAARRIAGAGASPPSPRSPASSRALRRAGVACASRRGSPV